MILLDFGGGLAGLNSAGITLGKGEAEAAQAQVLLQTAKENATAARQEREDKLAMQAKAEAKDVAAAKAASIIVCPPDQKVNPSYASLPVEARAQAAAAGITACLDDPKAKAAALKAGGGTPSGSTYFKAGGRKFHTTSAGFVNAVAAARAYAAQTGRPSLILRVGTHNINISACAFPQGNVQPINQPLMPQVVAAMPGAGGAFSCPAGTSIARNAANQVVCIAQAAAAAPSAQTLSQVVASPGGAAQPPSATSGGRYSTPTDTGSTDRSAKGQLHDFDPGIVSRWQSRTGAGPNIPAQQLLRYAPHQVQQSSTTSPTNPQCPPQTVLWAGQPFVVPSCMPLSELAAGNSQALESRPQGVGGRLATYGQRTAPAIPQGMLSRMPPGQKPTVDQKLAGMFGGAVW